ncbi:MAG: transposon-encoded TnpW family protein [Clostridiales bacterium]|nr:transposon-encoded TnpW family protein [Clostridiales bacterium]
MRKRIGSIVYEVIIHFNPEADETMNDKKLRLIRRDMEASQ